MSENEYQQLIKRMLAHDAASPMISSATGVKAARKAGKLAAREEIEWAASGWAGAALLWQPAYDERCGYYCLQQLIADARSFTDFRLEQLYTEIWQAQGTEMNNES